MTENAFPSGEGLAAAPPLTKNKKELCPQDTAPLLWEI